MELTNFRDLGNLIGFEGKRVKERAILRASQPIDLIESDISELKDVYKLAQIVDFRGAHEVASQPIDPVFSTDYLNIDILATMMKKKPSVDEIVKNLTPGMVDEFMSEVYVELVVHEDAKIGYRQFIDILLDPKGTLLFHCRSGKDRTGWGAVIILKILGVSDEDIMTDYLASIAGRSEENAKMVEAHRKKGLNKDQLYEFKEMLSVKGLYLEVAFETVKKEFGDFPNYLKEALQVTDEEIVKLRDLYLV